MNVGDPKYRFARVDFSNFESVKNGCDRSVRRRIKSLVVGFIGYCRDPAVRNGWNNDYPSFGSLGQAMDLSTTSEPGLFRLSIKLPRLDPVQSPNRY